VNSARSATEEIADALYAPRYAVDDEAQLQLAIEKVLRAREWAVRREVDMQNRPRRIDFVVGRREWWIGVEVKVKGAPGAVLRQVSTYLENRFWLNGAARRLDGLVLATTRSAHDRTMGGIATLSDRPFVVALLSRGM